MIGTSETIEKSAGNRIAWNMVGEKTCVSYQNLNCREIRFQRFNFDFYCGCKFYSVFHLWIHTFHMNGMYEWCKGWINHGYIRSLRLEHSGSPTHYGEHVDSSLNACTADVDHSGDQLDRLSFCLVMSMRDCSTRAGPWDPCILGFLARCISIYASAWSSWRTSRGVLPVDVIHFLRSCNPICNTWISFESDWHR